jgi:hypothetical protein
MILFGTPLELEGCESTQALDGVLSSLLTARAWSVLLVLLEELVAGKGQLAWESGTSETC